MTRIARGLGNVLLVLAALLALVGVSTWPPGGLMFALPFVFFLPAAFFALIGGTLLWVGQRRNVKTPESDDWPLGGGI